jgi:dCMP deaminase
MKKRLSVDDYYLGVAKAVSMRSTCLVRQYGAVIVNHSEIVSTGYNGSPRGEINCCDIEYCKRYAENSKSAHNDGNYNQCESVHAEMNAIISASRKEMLGATLYLFGSENGKPIIAEPCPVCSRLIKNAGIKRVVKGA